MKCRIVKVGRGASKPAVYRRCVICNEEIKDFRFEVVQDEGPNSYYDVKCMAEFYFNIKMTWWYRLFAFLHLVKMEIFIELPDVDEADGSDGSDNIDRIQE